MVFDISTQQSLDELEQSIKKQRPKGHHIGCAVDGSEMSERAARECVKRCTYTSLHIRINELVARGIMGGKCLPPSVNSHRPTC